MAKTLGFLRTLSAHGGRGPVVAYGTVAAIGDTGTFAIRLDSEGSVCMRNIETCVVTQIGTVAAIPTATGTSGQYVTVNIQRLGTLVATGHGNGTLDLQFWAVGGGGSV